MNKQTHPAYMNQATIDALNKQGFEQIAKLRAARGQPKTGVARVLADLLTAPIVPADVVRQDFQDTVVETEVEVSSSGGHVQLHSIIDPAKLGESWT